MEIQPQKKSIHLGYNGIFGLIKISCEKKQRIKGGIL